MDPFLRDILVCPVDHAPLRDDDDALVCTACARRYPVVDGIPVMLTPEERASLEAPGE